MNGNQLRANRENATHGLTSSNPYLLEGEDPELVQALLAQKAFHEHNRMHNTLVSKLEPLVQYRESDLLCRVFAVDAERANALTKRSLDRTFKRLQYIQEIRQAPAVQPSASAEPASEPQSEPLTPVTPIDCKTNPIPKPDPPSRLDTGSISIQMWPRQPLRRPMRRKEQEQNRSSLTQPHLGASDASGGPFILRRGTTRFDAGTTCAFHPRLSGFISGQFSGGGRNHTAPIESSPCATLRKPKAFF